LTGITLAPGQSLALGEVLFNVANGATPGSFGLSFTGSSSVADSNNLADPSAAAIPVDNFYGGTLMIGSVPEPSTALPLAGALLLGIFVIRYRRRLRA
jgi:PEP-CTERM motif-containing protein